MNRGAFQRAPEPRKDNFGIAVPWNSPSPAVCCSNGCMAMDCACQTRPPTTGPCGLLITNSAADHTGIASDLAAVRPPIRDRRCAAATRVAPSDSVAQNQCCQPASAISPLKTPPSAEGINRRGDAAPVDDAGAGAASAHAGAGLPLVSLRANPVRVSVPTLKLRVHNHGVPFSVISCRTCPTHLPPRSGHHIAQGKRRSGVQRPSRAYISRFFPRPAASATAPAPKAAKEAPVFDVLNPRSHLQPPRSTRPTAQRDATAFGADTGAQRAMSAVEGIGSKRSIVRLDRHADSRKQGAARP